MLRKCVLILSATGLVTSLVVAVGIGNAGASIVNPSIPGTVTCTPTHGVWSGLILFSPPIMFGGTSSTEVIRVKATLGNTANPCLGNTGVIAIGAIAGKIKLSIAGHASDCNQIFSGAAITPANASLKMVWSTPSGASPTLWKQPPVFKLKGAANLTKLNLTLGAVTGSFTPYATPAASFSDANWPGASGAVTSGCSSSTGLSSLTLSTSKGKW
jgi:hypothetical protein